MLLAGSSSAMGLATSSGAPAEFALPSPRMTTATTTASMATTETSDGRQPMSGDCEAQALGNSLQATPVLAFPATSSAAAAGAVPADVAMKDAAAADSEELGNEHSQDNNGQGPRAE
eukprot:Selendium_serpulae@DN5640_c0_g1_i2.p4